MRPIAEQQVPGNRADGPQEDRGRPVFLHIEDLPGHGDGAAERHGAHGVEGDAEGAEAVERECAGEVEGAHRQYEKRHALEGREFIPVGADEEEDAGGQHDAAEGHGHDHGPTRAPMGRLFRFKLPDAIGLLQVEELRLYPAIQRWFEFHSHGSHLD